MDQSCPDHTGGLKMGLSVNLNPPDERISVVGSRAKRIYIDKVTSAIPKHVEV